MDIARSEANRDIIDSATNHYKAAWDLVNRITKSKPRPIRNATPDEFNQFLLGEVDGIDESIPGGELDAAIRLDCFDMGIDDVLVPLVKWIRITPSDVAQVIN